MKKHRQSTSGSWRRTSQIQSRTISPSSSSIAGSSFSSTSSLPSSAFPPATSPSKVSVSLTNSLSSISSLSSSEDGTSSRRESISTCSSVSPPPEAKSKSRRQPVYHRLERYTPLSPQLIAITMNYFLPELIENYRESLWTGLNGGSSNSSNHPSSNTKVNQLYAAYSLQTFLSDLSVENERISLPLTPAQSQQLTTRWSATDEHTYKMHASQIGIHNHSFLMDLKHAMEQHISPTLGLPAPTVRYALSQIFLYHKEEKPVTKGESKTQPERHMIDLSVTSGYFYPMKAKTDAEAFGRLLILLPSTSISEWHLLVEDEKRGEKKRIRHRQNTTEEVEAEEESLFSNLYMIAFYKDCQNILLETISNKNQKNNSSEVVSFVGLIYNLFHPSSISSRSMFYLLSKSFQEEQVENIRVALESFLNDKKESRLVCLLKHKYAASTFNYSQLKNTDYRITSLLHLANQQCNNELKMNLILFSCQLVKKTHFASFTTRFFPSRSHRASPPNSSPSSLLSEEQKIRYEFLIHRAIRLNGEQEWMTNKITKEGFIFRDENLEMQMYKEMHDSSTKNHGKDYIAAVIITRG